MRCLSRACRHAASCLVHRSGSHAHAPAAVRRLATTAGRTQRERPRVYFTQPSQTLPEPVLSQPPVTMTPRREHRSSRLFAPVTRETPSAARSTQHSHNLLLQAGFVRSSSSGLYSFLPLGQRVLSKLIAIIDSEMASVNGQKLDLPLLLPSALWEKTGRWQSTGSELFRLQDRKRASYCLAPTHEESITDLIASEVKSYRDLPLRLYQIGKKFRDEARPRAGILRAREFLMKDLYSFDVSSERSMEAYDEVVDAYKRVFERLGLPFVQAEADTGNIGGSNSHEFHVQSEAGEDELLKCSHCRYAANLEKAVGDLPSPPAQSQSQSASATVKPSNLTDDNVLTRYVKSLMPQHGLRSDVSVKYEIITRVDNPLLSYIVLIDSNRAVNPTHVKEHVGATQCNKPNAAESLRLLGQCVEGKLRTEVLIDSSVVQHGVDLDIDDLSQFIQNTNIQTTVTDTSADSKEDDFDLGIKESEVVDARGEVDMHKLMAKIDSMIETESVKSLLSKFSVQKDSMGNIKMSTNKKDAIAFADTGHSSNGSKDDSDDDSEEKAVTAIENPRQGSFRFAQAGDRCTVRDCNGTLTSHKGIEVGHVFYLGTKYSSVLGAQFKSNTGALKDIEMGCYGLGVSRLLAAVIEVNNDSRGIVWPVTIAPYTTVIIPVDSKALTVAQSLYQSLSNSVSLPLTDNVLLDDRVCETDTVRLGARIRHNQLIGVPYLVIVGSNANIDDGGSVSGTVEIESRRDGAKVSVNVSEVKEKLLELHSKEMEAGVLRARASALPSQPVQPTGQ